MCKTCILQLVFLWIKNFPQIGEIIFSQPSLFWVFFVLTLSFHLSQYVCNFFRHFWRSNLLSDTRIRLSAYNRLFTRMCARWADWQEISSKMLLILMNKSKRIWLRLHPFLSPIVVGNARVKPICNGTLDLVLLYILYKFINLLLIP